MVSLRSLVGAALTVLTALPCVAFADESVDPPERLTGLSIAAIEIEAAPTEDRQALLVLSGLQVGAPFSPAAVRRAVKLLYQLGRFDNVYVRAVRASNQVRLRLILPPRGIVRELRLIASEILTRTEIEEAIGVTTDSQIDPRRVPEMSAALEQTLLERGYRDAAVGMALDSADESGGLHVLVRIDEGPQTLAGRIVVEGVPRLPRWELASRLGVSEGDVVDLRVIGAELLRLRAEYTKLGYWDAEIGTPRVVRLNRTGEGHPLAAVIFRIDAGPKVTVDVIGNHEVPRRFLTAETTPLVELGTGPSVIEEVKERILARYQRRGYYKAQVRVRTVDSPDGAERRIVFLVREGDVGRVMSLAFPGATEVDADDLERRVHGIVQDAMIDDLGKPGADPAVVGAIIGDQSIDHPRDTPQPDGTAPDPERVYIARAYREAGDAVGDMYRVRGYQTVVVERPIVTPRKNPALLDVKIPVRPGVKWLVGALSFTGNEHVSAGELFELSQIDPTAGGASFVSFDRVEEARRSILVHYRNLGHLYATVAEDLRQVPPRGSLGTFGYVSTSTTAPLDVRSVCRVAEESGADTCDVELVFRIDEGPKVMTRDVIVRGVRITQNDVVNGELLVKDGAILRERDMVETRDNLLRVGVFERVSVRPLDAEQVASEKDVVVEVRERKNLSLEVGIGASTEEGIRTFAGFGDNNLGGSALRLQLLGKLNVWLPQLLVLYNDNIREEIRSFYDSFSTFDRLEFEVAAGLSYPRIFGLPPGFTAGLDVIAFRDYDPAFAENTQKVTLIGDYKGFRPTIGGGPRPVALQMRLDFEHAALQCNESIQRRRLCSTKVEDSTDPRVAGDNTYVSIGPSVSWDLRDEPLNPTQGMYFELESAFAKSLFDTSPDHLRLVGRANFYVRAPFISGVGFAASVMAGHIIELSEGDIPVNRRFFSGGRRTVRGYAEKTLVPQDIELESNGLPSSTISSGGRSTFAVKTELRFQLFGPIAMAVFYDVGDLYLGAFRLKTTRTVVVDEATGETRDVTRSLAHGIGIGVRVATPIGPLTFDLALPLNTRDLEGRSPVYHFAVGTF